MVKITLKPNDQTYQGKPVYRKHFLPGQYLIIKFVGETLALVENEFGKETFISINNLHGHDDLNLYEPPQKYVNKAMAVAYENCEYVKTYRLYASKEEAFIHLKSRLLEWPACDENGKPYWVRCPVRDGE